MKSLVSCLTLVLTFGAIAPLRTQDDAAAKAQELNNAKATQGQTNRFKQQVRVEPRIGEMARS